LLGALAVILVTTMAVFGLTVGDPVPRAVGLLALGTLLAGSVWLICSQARQSAVRSWFVVWSFAFVSVIAFAIGGIAGNQSLYMAMAVLSAGLLLGPRAAVITTVCGALAASLVGWLMTTGRLPSPALASVSPTDAASWIRVISNAVMVWVFAAFVVTSVVSLLERAVRRAAEIEEQLRDSEARWRSIVHSAIDGIVVIDRRGRIEAFNPAAERMFGYAEHEVLGQNVHILMPSPDREAHDGYISRYLETGAPKIIGIGREVEGVRRNGVVFPLHLAVSEMTLKGERKFTGILHDLTSRVRMEKQLREREALAHLGEMAGVIAHEVRNPLAGIRGAIQIIGSRVAPGSGDASVVDEIVKRIDGLASLVKDLLLFARPPQLKPATVSVSDLVAQTARLLASDPNMRDVRVQIGGDAAPIVADPELLKIAFMNVLLNGAHAIQGHGVIRVSVDAVDHVCRVQFHDDGPGIPTAVREKMFTPFFTTKSRGTGLGLATTKRLVDAHGGQIEIDCPPSGGTVVTIQLPASRVQGHDADAHV